MIAYAYIRVSGDEQADRGLPVAGQRQEIQRYAEQHDITLARVFVDEARPGSTDDRASFQLLMRLAHQDPPPAQIILLWSWSRFARDQDDAHYWKASLRRHGVQIQDISGETPPVDGFEYVVESLIHWKDAQRLREISLDARRGQQTLARAGFIPSGGPCPRGYRVELVEQQIEGRRRRLRRWVPDPAAWPLVRLAWRMRLEGRSYRDIWRATRLYKTPACFNTFFSNTAYKGVVTFGGTPISVEPVVTPDQWAAVNDARRARESGAYARRQSSPFLLSGLLTCARCGAAINGSHSSSAVRNDGYPRARWPHYICTKRKRGQCDLPRIAAQPLEDIIIGVLFDQILTPDALAAQIDAIQAQLDRDRPALQAQLDQLQSSLIDLDRAINRLVDAIERAPDAGALIDRLNQRESERAHTRARYQAVQAQLTQPPPTAARLADLRAQLQAALAAGPTPQARALLRTLIAQILLDHHTATIRYNLPPPF